VTCSLPNGKSLVLAANYATYRNQKKYFKGITPDVIVPQSKENKTETLEEPINWIN
jgi:hypothetical protein